MTTRRVRAVMFAFAVSVVAAPAAADVVLPAILGDGVVLQRDDFASVWGWSAPREAIEVTPSWSGNRTKTFADDRGNWKLQLQTPGAGGPHTLTVKGDTTVIVRDVMIGEVWVGSGQSNMEMPLGNFGGGYTGVHDSEAEIAAASDPYLRLFTVENRASAMPRIDCRGQWRACTPESARGFSATAYFFGRELRRELGVPVGLISADWGGTPARSWTSSDALSVYPQYESALAHLREMSDPNARTAVVQERVRRWWETLGDGDMDRAFATDVAPDSARWRSILLPGAMSGDGLGTFDGLVYFRRVFDVPAAAAGRAARLDLGPIDDYDDVWINGRHVGATHAPGAWATPRSYAVPAGILRAGRNVIGIRVLDTGGPGGLHGTPAQLRIYPQAAGAIALAGEWQVARGRSVDDLPPRPLGPEINAGMPSTLFNGMIAPLTNHAIRGVIWYQGESDRRRAAHYAELFPAMIGDWRRQWDRGDFPFYFVQIAPFGYGDDTGETAALREAQTAALTLANTGMVVTLDLGNPADIHPKNKQEVGRRLALWALARTYANPDLPHAAPSGRMAGVQRTSTNTAILVGFGPAGAPQTDDALELRRVGANPFEIAGSDGVFVPAESEVRGHNLRVWSPHVPDPVAVRYAWSPAPEAALFAGGLPVAPFRLER